MKKDYNWWDDPVNTEEVKRISWWEHPENKTIIELPVSIIQEGEHWTIGTNKETEKLIGESLSSITSQGKSKEEVVSNFFLIMKMIHSFEEEGRRKYQRWVPFRKGDWKHIGGKWFVIFGIHFYFRTRRGMKGGWYIPFTNLNISVHSEWTSYNRWKKSRNNER
jgi:hypothetical protein